MSTLPSETCEKYQNPIFSSSPIPTKWDAVEEKKCVFACRTRYIILALGAMCISALLSNTITFNFTVICMTEVSTTVANNSSLSLNDTFLEVDFTLATRPKYPGGKYEYSPTVKSLLFSIMAIGALAFVVPSTWLMKRFGARKMFAAILFVSGAATGLAPAAAHLGLPYFLAVRVLQGVGMASFMPVVGTITASWASLEENGVFVSVLTGFLPFLTMLSGELCASSAGWPAVYYVHAAFTLALGLVWFGFYRDTPGRHPCVSRNELEKISHGKAANSLSQKGNSKMDVPYKAICMTPAVWAVWVATLGNYSAGQLVIVYMPTFFNNILGYSIEESSRYAVLACYIQLFVKLGSGLLSDKIHFLSDNNKLRLFNSLALGSCGVLFVFLSFIPFSNAALCVIILIWITTSIGFNVGGFTKAGTLVARHHSQFVMGVVQIVICISMLTGPFIVNAMTPTNSPSEWSLVFLTHGVLLLVTNVFFCIFTSAAPAPWALDTWVPKQKKCQISAAALGLPA